MEQLEVSLCWLSPDHLTKLSATKPNTIKGNLHKKIIFYLEKKAPF